MPARIGDRMGLGDMINLDEPAVCNSPYQTSNPSQRNISLSNTNDNMKSPLIMAAKRTLNGRNTMIERTLNKEFTADLSKISNDK